MKRLFHEPLLHFLLLGALVFAVYGHVSNRSRGGPGRIVVTQGQVAALAVAFQRSWQRSASSAEMEGLIRDWVREEVYCREAVALGLDKDDVVIRRRLRQKMEFVSDDLVAQAQPTDDELNKYLEAHPDSFRTERHFTFRQVFLEPGKHGPHLARDAAQLLEQLSQAGGAADLSMRGDPFMLEHTVAGVPANEVAQQFGDKFAAELGVLSPGQWHGPVASAYGVHLVFIRERTEAGIPALAEVREAVARDWANARRLEANDLFYDEMLKRYTVTIERPQPVVTKAAVVQ